MIFDFSKKKSEQPDKIKGSPTQKRRLREGEYTRYRDCQISFRATAEEKELAMRRFRESNFSSFQAYAMNALVHPMPDDKIIGEYAALETALDRLYIQLQGMANNINQMARKANSEDVLPELEQLCNATAALRGEVDDAWQSIRFQLHELQAMRR